MTKFISVDKMSKKQRKEYFSSRRNDWGTMSPITRVVPNKKKNFDFSRYED